MKFEEIKLNRLPTGGHWSGIFRHPFFFSLSFPPKLWFEAENTLVYELVYLEKRKALLKNIDLIVKSINWRN